ncbi:MAG: protein kinase, partial [Planctomycetaceae bacterium]|nr:protein kinase [Planctomycetaceae bacterium]
MPVPQKVDETRDEPPGGAHFDETPALPPHQLPQPRPVSDQQSVPAVSVQSIGRYRIERQLGQGGFGAVYLAMDDELNRRVAIKVPRRLAATQLAEYREEAQKLAKLEHPGVVPIYDIGHTTEFPVFLVTKFIEGGTLSDWVQNARPDFLTVSRLIAEVAEALHATHLKGIFHRDIKPANILVDANGKPYLADFGLALTEGHGLNAAPEILGTPAYMSPEQAAGEGHRVDGQTDIFSLGVVLYELLTGLRPFRASEQLPPRERSSQLLDMVKTFDPRPPRQINDQVPKELERICLKALAKRKPERYTTARDIAEDLRHFAGNPATQEVASVRVHVPPTRDSSTPVATPTPGTTPQVISDREPLKIVPKGLRSFDASDASFFLDLLPGPRDRDGLPESIRFWKTRIESHDAEVTFSAGVLYGPSGCGKSSLVKAGLIPHLASDIVPIYLEASGDDTEVRLSRAIRRACPGFGDDLSLTVLLKNLRRGVGLPSGKRRALIVLDQFEQWLHAKRGQTNQELPAALRQCDGDRVQCLILVRDDFWLAISRFLQELEVRLVEGENCAMADLFDPPHARKVLDAFGVAFGKVGWDSVPTNSLG